METGTNYFIVGEKYPTIEEVKDILKPKGYEFHKGREQNSFEVIQTYDDEISGNIIIGKLRNLIIIKTKVIKERMVVISYSTNPKAKTFSVYDLNLGLIDRGYSISVKKL